MATLSILTPQQAQSTSKLMERTKELRTTLRNYAIDTGANISFYGPVNMFNEVIIAGMNPEQSLKVRMSGAIVSLFSGRTYGKIRGKIYNLTGINENTGQIKKALVDTASSFFYGLPIYIVQMAVAGVDRKHMLYGIGTNLISSAITARPYGAYLDLLRKSFKAVK